MYDKVDTLPDIVMIFLIHISAPVIVYGLKKIDSLYALMIPFAIYLTFVDIRAMSIIQLLLVINFGKNIPELHSKTKKMIILLFIFMFGFYILEFVMGSWKMIIYN